jgi:DnaK suppressor protein
MLDREALAYFGDLLTVRLDEATRAMRGLHLRIEDHEHHQEPMDDVDLTTIGSEQKLKIQIQQRTRRLVLEIEEALRRIKSGSFGTCKMCGNRIEMERLRVQPTTTLCVLCKREMEALERRNVACYGALKNI